MHFTLRRKAHGYLFNLISTSPRSPRRGAFELCLDLILLWKVHRQPLGPDHIKKIFSCISPYDGRPMGTYSILISTSLRRVRRQPLGSNQNFKNHCIHFTLRWKAHRCKYSFFRQMTPRSRAKPHCMHLFSSGISVWIPGSWLDKTLVSSVF